MRLKFIKLFEDYKDELNAETSETGHSWMEVRDAIQTKRPFVIVVFKNTDSYKEAVSSYFSEFDYVKQTAYLSSGSTTIKYPSIFFTLDADYDFSSKVKEIYEKFKIKRIIIGKLNSEFSTLYSQDGTSSDFGNEIVASLSEDEFKHSDYFKIGSQYYNFVNFTT